MAYRLGTPYTLALLLTAVFTFGLAVATLGHRNERASRPLFGFLAAIGLWSFGDALRVAAPTESAVLLWNTVAYAGIVFVPPTLLLFALAYTGCRRWLQRRYVAGLCSVSVVVFGVILTNPVHSLWLDVVSITPGTPPPVLSEDWGPLWYPWAVYVYGVVLVVTYLLARRFLVASRSGIHRVQTGLVLAGILTGVAVNLLFIAGVTAYDPTPFAFAVTGVTFGLATFRYRLLTVVPIARDTVLRNVDSGVLVLDADDRVADTNDRFRRMFALEGEALRGAPVSTVCPGSPAIRDLLESTARSDSVTLETEGDSRHYHVKSSRMVDAVETYVGRVFVFTDITRRVNQEERLRERTAELERRNEQLDQFASVVSHDLRNPLNVISGRAELASDATDPDPHIDAILDAAERMEGMIDEVLTLARQGEAVGQRESVPLDEVAERAWTFVDSGEATLTVDTSKTVMADPDRSQEAFGNLFRNAVEHAGPDVHVRVGALPDGFFVEDDGPGVPECDRSRLFEAGYTTQSDGTGLGLSIVRTVVEAHGWRVSIAESADGGARFEVVGVGEEG
jgi:signal transduction histidine kinase